MIKRFRIKSAYYLAFCAKPQFCSGFKDGFSGLLVLVAMLLFFIAALPQAFAQEGQIPDFWDKHERFVKPDLSSVVRLRFLTTTDFPPFNFIDRNKRLTGFHVDLARAICKELDLLPRCQIQALPWEELGPALEKGDGEVMLAGLEITAATREKYEFSRAYFHIPGRFVTPVDSKLSGAAFDALSAKTVGVVAGSSHEAYFDKAFGKRSFKPFPTRADALAAMRKKEVDAVFSDGVSLAFWLASEASSDCCRFFGGPYISLDYFGKGMAVAVPKGREDLKDAMNHALKNINDQGQFGELYLRYFPVGIF